MVTKAVQQALYNSDWGSKFKFNLQYIGLKQPEVEVSVLIIIKSILPPHQFSPTTPHISNTNITDLRTL